MPNSLRLSLNYKCAMQCKRHLIIQANTFIQLLTDYNKHFTMGICSSKQVVSQVEARPDPLVAAKNEEVPEETQRVAAEKNAAVLKSLELEHLEGTVLGGHVLAVDPTPVLADPVAAPTRSLMLFRILDVNGDGFLTREECRTRVGWFLEAATRNDEASAYLPDDFTPSSAEAREAEAAVVHSMMAHAGSVMQGSTGRRMSGLTYEGFVTWMMKFMAEQEAEEVQESSSEQQQQQQEEETGEGEAAAAALEAPPAASTADAAAQLQPSPEPSASVEVASGPIPVEPAVATAASEPAVADNAAAARSSSESADAVAAAAQPPAEAPAATSTAAEDGNTSTALPPRGYAVEGGDSLAMESFEEEEL